MAEGMEILLKTENRSDMEQFMTLVRGIKEEEHGKVLAFMQGISFGMELRRETDRKGGINHE